MPVPWDDDPPGSEGRIIANCAALVTQLAAASSARHAPTVGAAQDWHRSIYEGVTLPVPYYAGEVRDSDDDFPELIGYEVAVGPNMGAPSALVPDELRRFERRAQAACGGLDAVVAAGAQPSNDRELHAILTLCAVLHGEWVRIHPFANGNGRIARVWANWAAMRYGLPPFVRLKPRPEGMAYAAGAHASMVGDHTVAIAVFGQQLAEFLNSLA